MALSQEEFISQVVNQQIGANLDKKQKEFLEAIMGQDVIFKLTQKAKDNPQCQRLITELSQMQKRGQIASFQIVDI